MKIEATLTNASITVFLDTEQNHSRTPTNLIRSGFSTTNNFRSLVVTGVLPLALVSPRLSDRPTRFRRFQIPRSRTASQRRSPASPSVTSVYALRSRNRRVWSLNRKHAYVGNSGHAIEDGLWADWFAQLPRRKSSRRCPSGTF